MELKQHISSRFSSSFIRIAYLVKNCVSKIIVQLSQWRIRIWKLNRQIQQSYCATVNVVCRKSMDRFSHIWRIFFFCILYQEICILTVKMSSVVKICNRFWLPDAQMLVFRYSLGQTWEPHPKKVNVCNAKVGKYRGSF